MADESPSSFYQARISIAKKAFTDLVTAALFMLSSVLEAIKINFFDQLRKPAAPSSVSSYPQGFFVITEVLLISSNNTSHSATPTNTSSVMYTQSLPASNGDTHFSGITVSPSASASASSSSSSSPDSPPTSIWLQLTFLPAGLPLTVLPTEKPLAEDPAVGELKITFMQVPNPNPNPASSNEMHALSAFQKSDLSRVIFAVVAPVTGGILALMSNYSPQLYSTLPHWFMPFVICTLSFGSTFIIHGILFREKLPRFARALEELGVLILLLGFCSLVTKIIPKNVVWAPWSCYVLTLLALAVLRFHEAASEPSGSSSTASAS